MKNDLIVLVVKTASEKNEDGLNITEFHEKEVFADIQSVKRTEFYMANRNGIDLDLTAVVNLPDYEEAFVKENEKKIVPTIVKYDGESFKIERAYSKGKYKVELMLSKIH